MKTYLRLTAICVSLFTASCSTTGVPTEFSKACDVENDKKHVEVGGFLESDGSMFCSNIGGGRLECGLKLKENPVDGKNLSIYIEQGTSSNAIEKLPSGYKKEDIKIRDNGGNVVALTDKVKLTGKMRIGLDGTPCFMQVDKIEK